MSNINKTISRKQHANVVNAKRWLRRAQMDFNAFKMLVKFDKNTHKMVRCNDSSLAVYLLQQSIEKATKAVAAATGKYSYKRLKGEGHNSLILLLSFYQEILMTITSYPDINNIGIGLGINLKDSLDKISNLMPEVKKTPKERKDGELLYSEQLAQADEAGIQKTLDFLLTIRTNASIGVLKTIFGPHSKIIIDKQKLNINNPKDFVASLFNELGKQVNTSQLTDNHFKLFEDIVRLWAPEGIIDDNNENIVLERHTKDQLGQWAMLALFVLAMYTFPHESSTRYPCPSLKKQNIGVNGYEDYDENLGIVRCLGKMGYITMLVMSDIENQLDTVASFYPVVETKFNKSNNNKNSP